MQGIQVYGMSIMKLFVKYLLRDFDNHKLVLKNHKSRELIFILRTVHTKYSAYTQGHFSQESFLLRKKTKTGLIAADDLIIAMSISYTE